MDTSKLFEAIDRGDEKTVQRLVEADPGAASRLNERDATPILAALYAGHRNVAEAIAFAAPSITIHEAAAMDNVAALRARIMAGEDVDDASPDGFAPLHLAAFFGHVRSMNVLIAAGADVDRGAAKAPLLRPIHSAAASRRAEAVRVVISAGGEIDAAQAGGYTALHSALLHGNRAMAMSLLANGASVSIAANDGRTAVDFARIGELTSIMSRFTLGEVTDDEVDR